MLKDIHGSKDYQHPLKKLRIVTNLPKKSSSSTYNWNSFFLSTKKKKISSLGTGRISLNIKTRYVSKIISTRLIIMLITINISFCLFSMPITILQIIYHYSDHFNSFYPNIDSLSSIHIINETKLGLLSSSHLDESKRNSMIELFHSIAEVLQFLNHGSNFFLYSLSGKTFRKKTKTIFICIIKKIFSMIKYKSSKKTLRKNSQIEMFSVQI